MARVVGLVLLVVGVILFLFGLNATESVTDTVSEGLTGRYTDDVVSETIGGAALFVGGGALALVGRGSARSV